MEKTLSDIIQFLPLQKEHISLLWQWLKEPHVAEFWQESEDEEKFRQKFLEKRPEKGVFPFLIALGSRPIGYIQYYEARKIGDVWWPQANEGTFGIDQFIGDPTMINKGYGTIIIRKFVEQLFRNPQVKEVIADPDPKNTRAIRAYEKVGFQRVGDIKTPDGDASLLHMERLNPRERLSRIHIFGASGSGTTTLAKQLSQEMNIRHFDADDYYWKKTNPPFIEKNSIPERHRLLLADMDGLTSWVLSGAMDSWSDPFLPLFNLVVFLHVSTEVRIERLRRREQERYGDRIRPGGDMHQAHLEFIEWAAQYDQGYMSGRSKKRHEEWMARLPCPVLRIENEITTEASVQLIMERMK